MLLQPEAKCFFDYSPQKQTRFVLIFELPEFDAAVKTPLEWLSVF